MMRPLTRRQMDVLQEIERRQAATGLSPTLEELGRTLDVNRVTVFGHVQALLQKGYLENLEPGASRGLELTERGRAALRRGGSPLVLAVGQRAGAGGPGPYVLPLLGRIAAGSPLEALETPEPLDLEDLLPLTDDLYLLEVEGDSMIEDHIQSGDYVVVRRGRLPQPGDIVVAVLGGEVATLKRCYPDPAGGYRLVPANRHLQPMRVERLEVRGVVTGVIRRY